jgi:hypothetical protein
VCEESVHLQVLQFPAVASARTPTSLLDISAFRLPIVFTVAIDTLALEEFIVISIGQVQFYGNPNYIRPSYKTPCYRVTTAIRHK